MYAAISGWRLFSDSNKGSPSIVVLNRLQFDYNKMRIIYARRTQYSSAIGHLLPVDNCCYCTDTADPPHGWNRIHFRIARASASIPIQLVPVIDGYFGNFRPLFASANNMQGQLLIDHHTSLFPINRLGILIYRVAVVSKLQISARSLPDLLKHHHVHVPRILPSCQQH